MIVTRENILALLRKEVDSGEILSIYQVGIQDGSPLSDIDLVFVVKLKQNFSDMPQGVDVRAVFTRDEFISNAQYLPYASLALIYGEDIQWIKPDLSPEKINLIKLTVMQMTGFVRNFYELENSGDAARILNSLNDFAYANLWAPEFNPAGYADFWEKISELRQSYPSNKENAAAFMPQAIDYAWQLIEYLHSRLGLKIGAQKYARIFYGKHPTLIVNESASLCKKETETTGSFFRRSRIACLPHGFDFVLVNSNNADSEFVKKYVKYNLAPRISIKYLVQLMLVIMLKIRYTFTRHEA